MKLFIDDIRNPPDETWMTVRCPHLAIDIIALGFVTEISFDHDLGSDLTGYDVAKFIEEFHELMPIKWQVHSANPVGRKNIEAAMQAAERLYGRIENVH